ncbi:MAG: site-specific integrase [Planctomycetes bacterium]|nr:site-specific integrase [Planctomycetota bacterium]
MPRRSGRSVYGSLYQRPGRPGWYVRTRHGSRKNGTLTEKTEYAGLDKETATLYLAELHRKYDREDLLGIRTVVPVTFAEVKKPFLDFYWAKCGSKDPSSLKAKYEVIFKWLGERVVKDADAALIEDFYTYLKTGRKRTVGPRSIAHYRALLSPIFKWAMGRSYSVRNPALEVKAPKFEEPTVPYLSDEDVDARLSACSDYPDLRDYALVLSDTALRRAEGARLDRQDVDLRRNLLVIRNTKGKKFREVPMTARVRAVMERLLTVRADELRVPDYLFPRFARHYGRNAGTSFKHRLTKAGLPGTLHWLRHGVGSRLAQRGVPLPVIQRILGHSTIRQTMRYASHLPESAVKDAMAALARPKAEPKPERKAE